MRHAYPYARWYSYYGIGLVASHVVGGGAGAARMARPARCRWRSSSGPSHLRSTLVRVSDSVPAPRNCDSEFPITHGSSDGMQGLYIYVRNINNGLAYPVWRWRWRGDAAPSADSAYARVSLGTASATAEDRSRISISDHGRDLSIGSSHLGRAS